MLRGTRQKSLQNSAPEIPLDVPLTLTYATPDCCPIKKEAFQTPVVLSKFIGINEEVPLRVTRLAVKLPLVMGVKKAPL